MILWETLFVVRWRFFQFIQTNKLFYKYTNFQPPRNQSSLLNTPTAFIIDNNIWKNPTQSESFANDKFNTSSNSELRNPSIFGATRFVLIRASQMFRLTMVIGLGRKGWNSCDFERRVRERRDLREDAWCVWLPFSIIAWCKKSKQVPSRPGARPSRLNIFVRHFWVTWKRSFAMFTA